MIKNGNRTASSSNTYVYAANTNRLTDIKAGSTVLKSASYLATGASFLHHSYLHMMAMVKCVIQGGASGQYYMAYNHKYRERYVQSTHQGIGMRVLFSMFMMKVVI